MADHAEGAEPSVGAPEVAPARRRPRRVRAVVPAEEPEAIEAPVLARVEESPMVLVDAVKPRARRTRVRSTDSQVDGEVDRSIMDGIAPEPPAAAATGSDGHAPSLPDAAPSADDVTAGDAIAARPARAPRVRRRTRPVVQEHADGAEPEAAAPGVDGLPSSAPEVPAPVLAVPSTAVAAESLGDEANGAVGNAQSAEPRPLRSGRARRRTRKNSASADASATQARPPAAQPSVVPAPSAPPAAASLPSPPVRPLREGQRPAGRAGDRAPRAPGGRQFGPRRDERPGRPPRPAGPPQPGNARVSPNLREPNLREPERPRRGPIVDPRRRPSPDELAAQPQPSSRGRVAVGTISELARDRGFGFLIDGAGRKRFFHRSAVVAGAFDTLHERQSVQFEPRDDVKGLRAINVRPAPARQGGARPARPNPYDRGTTATRRDGAYGRTGGTRRPAEGGTAGPAWRSSLSPFRGDPPAGPPRRRRS